jgi:hypothetical protein
MKILITGDLLVNIEYSVDRIDKDVIDLFGKSDFNIVNLEAPVTKSSSKILKTGPHLKSNEESVQLVLKTLNVNLVTLANNHVLDYDEEGVLDTLSFCRRNNIQTVGAGQNLEEASQTLYLDIQEEKIAIVNFAENEWASATKEAAGANPMNIIDNANQIKEAKSRADYVIVIIHGGHEYYNLPSPRMQKQYHFYAECGADLVVGHHTHCINGNEIYNGVPIYYSLGNFLFTRSKFQEDWYNGLILEIEIKERNLTTKIHIIRQEKVTFELNLLKGNKNEAIQARIQNYNKIISDNSLLTKEWNKYVSTKYNRYLIHWSPISYINNRYIRAVINKLNLKIINKKGIARYLNLLRCEAHANLSKEIIQMYLERRKNKNNKKNL